MVWFWRGERCSVHFPTSRQVHPSNKGAIKFRRGVQAPPLIFKAVATLQSASSLLSTGRFDLRSNASYLVANDIDFFVKAINQAAASMELGLHDLDARFQRLHLPGEHKTLPNKPKQQDKQAGSTPAKKHRLHTLLKMIDGHWNRFQLEGRSNADVGCGGFIRERNGASHRRLANPLFLFFQSQHLLVVSVFFVGWHAEVFISSHFSRYRRLAPIRSLTARVPTRYWLKTGVLRPWSGGNHRSGRLLGIGFLVGCWVNRCVGSLGGVKIGEVSRPRGQVGRKLRDRNTFGE